MHPIVNDVSSEQSFLQLQSTSPTNIIDAKYACGVALPSFMQHMLYSAAVSRMQQATEPAVVLYIQTIDYAEHLSFFRSLAICRACVLSV